jgi:PBP1b-binding outer membrane lipoprotein LpoB
MKRAILILAVMLAGCSSLKDYIPSRWDVNQSKAVTDIQQTSRNFDCKGNISEQSKLLAQQVEWLDIYSKSKDTRDVAKITGNMNDTVKELRDRSSKGPVSPLYCEIKKKILIQQSDMIAHTVQGRF